MVIAMSNSQPTYIRQRFLLSFIRQLNESVSATDLQKLVFLYTMADGVTHYEFLPYRFGAYSFQLAEDVNILRIDKYVEITDGKIKASGKYLCDTSYNIAPERGNNLIRRAYRAYPYYTINSEMIGNLFYGEEAKNFIEERQKYINNEQTLFTIGYEGKSIEAFINTLLQNGIKLLCDVRKNPLSRKFGFSKSKLKHIAETVGIKYVHIPELGIETDKRRTLKTPDDYKALFDDYATTLPTLTSCLETVYSQLRSNNRIALMCYEKDALMCHRHVVRDYLVGKHNVRNEDL